MPCITLPLPFLVHRSPDHFLAERIESGHKSILGFRTHVSWTWLRALSSGWDTAGQSLSDLTGVVVTGPVERWLCVAGAVFLLWFGVARPTNLHVIELVTTGSRLPFGSEQREKKVSQARASWDPQRSVRDHGSL